MVQIVPVGHGGYHSGSRHFSEAEWGEEGKVRRVCGCLSEREDVSQRTTLGNLYAPALSVVCLGILKGLRAKMGTSGVLTPPGRWPG